MKVMETVFYCVASHFAALRELIILPSELCGRSLFLMPLAFLKMAFGGLIAQIESSHKVVLKCLASYERAHLQRGYGE